MSLQFRRGTNAQRQTITPRAGEPVWTTDTNVLYVGDGVTLGGIAAGSGGGSGGVTQIIAGTNISINTSTGAVTINAAGGSGSTSTYTDLTVLDKLYIGGVDGNGYQSHIQEDAGSLRLKSSNGQFAFESLDGEGVNVVSTDQISVQQLSPLTGFGGQILLYGELAFASEALGIRFYDNTVQTTAANLGDLTVNGTWLRNKTDGDIYISPQDGTTGIYFPSDTYSSSTAVQLFNSNTGTVQINSNGRTWTFNAEGGVTFPDSTIQTTAGAAPGQTSVHNRSALPSGNSGLTITISDSGSDDNSPAGNYALAYWDADVNQWLYVANSNSVTAI
jgi:hypothetical protein